MIEIKNTYEDRDVEVTSREVFTGRDHTTRTVGAGETVEVEVDGDWQISIATRGRHPGERPLDGAPHAKPVTDAETKADGDKADAPLRDASDDEVRTEIGDMVEAKTDLIASGAPNLASLNARLAERGFNPVTTEQRDKLMAPA